MQNTNTTLLALRGIGRRAYRTGGFPHHAARTAREILGRPLVTAELQAVTDGWTAERREMCAEAA